jgi:hypothetical protein
MSDGDGVMVVEEERLMVGLSGGSDCRGAMGRAGSAGAVVRDQYGKGRVRVTRSSGWGRGWWSSV